MALTRQDILEANTETRPAMEVHLGEVSMEAEPGTRTIEVRYCIIWINGKRWAGTLVEEPEDIRARREFHGEGSNSGLQGQ
jgi:hypothetical protein